MLSVNAAAGKAEIGIMRRLRLSPLRAFFQGLVVPDGFPPPSGFCLVSAAEVRGGEGAPVRVVHPDPGLRIVLAPDQPVPSDWYQFELRFPPEGLVDVVAQFFFRC